MRTKLRSCLTAGAAAVFVVGLSSLQPVQASGPMGPDDSTPAPSNPAPSNPTPTETFAPPTFVEPPPPTGPPGEPFMTTTTSTLEPNPPMPAPVPGPDEPIDIFTGSLAGAGDQDLLRKQLGCDANPEWCAKANETAAAVAKSQGQALGNRLGGSLNDAQQRVLNRYVATVVLALGPDPNKPAMPALVSALTKAGGKLLFKAMDGDQKALHALENLSAAVKDLDLTFGGN